MRILNAGKLKLCLHTVLPNSAPQGKQKLNSNTMVFCFVFAILLLQINPIAFYIFDQLFWYCVDTVSKKITTFLIFPS